MPSSLSILAANLYSEDFKNYCKIGKYFTTEDLPLVTRKSIVDKIIFIVSKYFFFLGVYPYEYTNSWIWLEEQQLPRRDEFYSMLIENDIREDNYKYAQNV